MLVKNLNYYLTDISIFLLDQYYWNIILNTTKVFH